jgi:hypothetical protein
VFGVGTCQPSASENLKILYLDVFLDLLFFGKDIKKKRVKVITKKM